MKKTLISTALKLSPKKLQNKALCKALNYIFAGNELSSLNNQTIKLTVSDLKKSWFVTFDENVFKVVKNHGINLEVRIKLETALSLQSRAFIQGAVKKGDIQLNGNPVLIDVFNDLISQLNERRLFNLSNNLFSFLRIKSIKSENHFDMNTVKLSDLKSPSDIDAVRDEALRIENDNLRQALVLMSLAHQARPKGKMIASKVIEYKKKLLF